MGITVPKPVRLFHITAIANLAGICSAGGLLSKNVGATNGIGYQNIAHAGAQGARAAKLVPNPPGGTIHDYVPFYFAPRSPMLYAVNRGKVQGCDWRQHDIVHIETTVELVTADRKEFVFYDRNATLAFSEPSTDLADLHKVAWELLCEPPLLDGFCKYWQNKSTPERYIDRMERRQAEFLVRDKVLIKHFVRIGAIDRERADEVSAILAQAGVSLPVEVKPDWYF